MLFHIQESVETASSWTGSHAANPGVKLEIC